MSLVFARALPAGVSGTVRPEAVLSLPLSGLPYSVGSKRWSPGTSQKWVLLPLSQKKNIWLVGSILSPSHLSGACGKVGRAPRIPGRPVPLSCHSSLLPAGCPCEEMSVSGSSRPMHYLVLLGRVWLPVLLVTCTDRGLEATALRVLDDPPA